MDLTVLWVILGVLGAIGFIIGLYYLLKKAGVDFSKFFKSVDIAQIGLEYVRLTVIQMFKDNPDVSAKAETIIEVIIKSLEFIDKQIDELDEEEYDKDELIAQAELYATSLLDSLNIQLEEGVVEIMHLIIKTAYNMIEALRNNA